MPVLLRGIIFAVLGVLVIFKLVRAGRTGEISSRGFTFAYGSSPIWFVFGVVCFVVIFMFCVGEVGFAAGLVPDPVVLLNSFLKGT